MENQTFVFGCHNIVMITFAFMSNTKRNIALN